MGFQRICSLDKLWEGEMQAYAIGTVDVLIVNAETGIVRAFNAYCPHQDSPLADGTLDGKILTCAAHLWQFDVETGQGVNPTGCRLKEYPVRIEGDEIFVDVEAPAPVR